MDIKKLMLFHFLSHICACTYTHSVTHLHAQTDTHMHTHMWHTHKHAHAHAHTCTSGWSDWSPGGYEVILDKCMYTVKIHRPGVYQTSVGFLKNVLIMTVTMIKSLIIIVDKIINMVPLDCTTNSYSVEETISYFENYLNFPLFSPLLRFNPSCPIIKDFRTVRIKLSYTLIL